MNDKEYKDTIVALQIQFAELHITVEKLKDCVIGIESRLAKDSQKKSKKNLIFQIIELIILIGVFIASLFIKRT